MLSRRQFMATTAAVATLSATRLVAQDRKTLQVFIDGDTNISD